MGDRRFIKIAAYMGCTVRTVQRWKEEAGLGFLVIEQMVGEEFEVNCTIKCGVLGLIDDTDAAFSELLDDLVTRYAPTPTMTSAL